MSGWLILYTDASVVFLLNINKCDVTWRDSLC